MTYTFRFTEEEVAYIRRAVCDKNMHHCIRGLEGKDKGDSLAHSINMELRSIGHAILHIIDKTKETQTQPNENGMIPMPGTQGNWGQKHYNE